jgi:hypothetical protein
MIKVWGGNQDKTSYQNSRMGKRFRDAHMQPRLVPKSVLDPNATSLRDITIGEKSKWKEILKKFQEHAEKLQVIDFFHDDSLSVV